MSTPLGNEVIWDKFTREKLDYLYLANEAIELRENYRQRDYAFWTHYLNDMVFGEDGPVPPS